MKLPSAEIFSSPKPLLIVTDFSFYFRCSYSLVSLYILVVLAAADSAALVAVAAFGTNIEDYCMD